MPLQQTETMEAQHAPTVMDRILLRAQHISVTAENIGGSRCLHSVETGFSQELSMPLRQMEIPGAQHSSVVTDGVLPGAQHTSVVDMGEAPPKRWVGLLGPNPLCAASAALYTHSKM